MKANTDNIVGDKIKEEPENEKVEVSPQSTPLMLGKEGIVAPKTMFEMAELRKKYREEQQKKTEEAERLSCLNSPRCSDNWLLKQEAAEK